MKMKETKEDRFKRSIMHRLGMNIPSKTLSGNEKFYASPIYFLKSIFLSFSPSTVKWKQIV